MMYGKMTGPAKKPAAKKVTPFKPCKGCPNPTKCAKMGTCMAKAAKK